MISIIGILISYLISDVSSHGRLIEPPSRASMWRYGFKTPPNYNDHELYCGGFTKQWQINKGKCGICGDPWEGTKPRPHEAGGKYAQGIIVRKYKMNSMFTIRVELTANHRGYFEFRLCPNNNPKIAATQDCLDKYILKRSKMGTKEPDDVFHETRFYPGPGNRVFEIRYNLPPDLTCTQCVLQWRYIAGNNWGICPNNTGAVGCGPQEEFRSCSDISIINNNGITDNTPYVTTTEKPIRKTTTYKPTIDEDINDNIIPIDEDINEEQNEHEQEEGNNEIESEPIVSDSNIGGSTGSDVADDTENDNYAENDNEGEESNDNSWFNWINQLFNSIRKMFSFITDFIGGRSINNNQLFTYRLLKYSISNQFKIIQKYISKLIINNLIQNNYYIL